MQKSENFIPGLVSGRICNRYDYVSYECKAAIYSCHNQETSL